MKHKRIPDVVIAIALQIVAIAMVVLAINILQISISSLSFITVSAVLVFALSYLAHLPRWWLVMQLLFLPMLTLVWSWQIPSWLFLLGFIILLLVYWSNFKGQVPLYLSSPLVWQKVAELIPNKPAAQVIDLGCGLGGLIQHLAQQRPDIQLTGVELAPLPYLYSKLRLAKYQHCQILRQSIWDTPLANYDVVFAYLSPVPMERLWQKVSTEMKSGSLFISCSFAVPNIEPDEVITLNDFDGAELLVYRV